MEISKLAIDIDETIVDFLPEFLEWYNTEEKADFATTDFTSYRWWEVLGIPKELAYRKAGEYIQDRMAWFDENLTYGHMQIALDPQAERAMMVLGRRYEFYGITDRDFRLDLDTFETSCLLYYDELEARGIDGLVLPYDRIFYTRNKSGKRVKTKAEICLSNKITTIIDDNPDIARECLESGIFVYMPAKPWNENHPRSPLVYRGSWKDICKKLR